MRLRELMSHPVVSCSSGATLDHPARLMWEFDCGTIPVVDDDGRLVGMITDRDICMGSLMQGKPLHEIPVRSVMAHDLVSCHADDSVETAEHAMRDNRIRRIPVLDNDRRPLGIVSLNDLARLAFRAPSQRRRSRAGRDAERPVSAACAHGTRGETAGGRAGGPRLTPPVTVQPLRPVRAYARAAP
jgi:CBS domain-containing protein